MNLNLGNWFLWLPWLWKALENETCSVEKGNWQGRDYAGAECKHYSKSGAARSQVRSRLGLDVGGGLSSSGCSLIHTQDTQHSIIYMGRLYNK